ncbi:hypothetical protein Aduo_012525 [Ancylostoma duodenale]
MPGAPRFTQKPSIQQTPTGDLLMECLLEADPPPTIAWQHSGNVITPSARVVQMLTPQGGILYKANLVIKEPNAGDGGAYKCTAKNQLGESNANINLNFAGAGAEEPKSKGPSFVGKPRIIPKDGGALIVMECKVKSPTPPVAKWMKDGVPLQMGGLYHAVFTDLGDQTFLCQLEIRGPSASDAGQYRCNLRNEQGETNANLALNFEEPDPSERQERIEKKSRRSPSEKRKDASSPRPPSRGGGSRPGSPKKAMKSRESTPKRGLKEKEGSPAKKSMRFASIPSMASYRVLALPFRSRTSTPVQESASTLGPEDAVSPGDSRRSSKNMSKMEVDSTTVKRKPEGLPVPPQADEKKMRTSSPVPPEPAMQEIPEKMEKTPTPPKSKSPTPPEPAKQQIPEKKEKTPTPPKSKSPAPSEPEKPQIPEKKDRSPAAPEPAKQIPEKKDRSPAPPSRQDQAKRDKFTRPPIVMEASKSKVGEVAGVATLAGTRAHAWTRVRRKGLPLSRCKVSMCPRFASFSIAKCQLRKAWITGKPGDSLTLEVEWQCHTSTVIEWYKDGTKIKMTDDYHATFDGTKARLTVRNLTEEKTGLYKCHAVCQYGEGQSSCMIKMDSSEEEYTRKRSIDEPPKDKPLEKKISTLSVTKESDEESLSQSLAPAKRKKSRSKSPVSVIFTLSEKTLDELPKQKVVRPDPDEVCSLGHSPIRSFCVVMTRATG